MAQKYCEAFETVHAESKKLGERNDCTVKAITITTGLPYTAVHAELKKLGRRKGCGTTTDNMVLACRSLGFDMAEVKRGSWSAKTCRTAPRDRRLASMGPVILGMARHVAAYNAGEVLDWSENRTKRIRQVWTVTPIPGFAPAPVAKRAELPEGSEKWQSFRKYTKHDNLNLF
jgi:hypothetical protein